MHGNESKTKFAFVCQGRRGGVARNDILRALDGAILAADPQTILRENLSLRGSTLRIRSLSFDLSRYRRVVVIGGGKASGKMALELEKILGNYLTAGTINIPDYQELSTEGSLITFNPATHPIPSVQGLRGVKRMMKVMGVTSSDDFIICLISGGASALLPSPAEGITIGDEARVTELLLTSGADIQEINTVRKHLSSIKGGRLAEMAYPATVVSLIISDVVGDRVDFVGSGPTAPDPTTYSDAKRVLVARGIWTKVGRAVRGVIEGGIRGRAKDTPKPGSKVFSAVHNVVLGSNRASRVRAAEILRNRGYHTTILRREIEGEARTVGTRIARMAVEKIAHNPAYSKPWALVAGGETVVTVKHGGKGGRNQELVLSAAIGIEGVKSIAIGSVGTDGIDGPTDAAGAIADGATVTRGRNSGFRAEDFLNSNNSYRFFQKLGDLVITGPTGTNVNDILVVLGRPGAQSSDNIRRWKP